MQIKESKCEAIEKRPHQNSSHRKRKKRSHNIRKKSHPKYKTRDGAGWPAKIGKIKKEKDGQVLNQNQSGSFAPHPNSVAGWG